MDLARIPAGLRQTLREILECGNERPFRHYYRWVANKVKHEAKQGTFSKVAELGAGTAPVTRRLARETPQDAGLKLIPCDLHPDVEAYESLREAYPGVVSPIFTPVDFSRAHAWDNDTLLVLSGTFHHVPQSARPPALEALLASARRIVICEPLQNRPSSFAYVLLSIVPAALLPLLLLGRSGRLRRVLWCWLLPVAPLMFWWDGWVSCSRQWDAEDWRAAAERLGFAIRSFEAGTFSYALVLEDGSARPSATAIGAT
jgi:hypothetical protein